MKIGITTFDLENFDFQVQLRSLLKNDIEPAFVILHFGGKLYTGLRYIRFLTKTIEQYRFKCIAILLKKIKSINTDSSLDLSFTQNDKSEIDAFLGKVKILKVKGINDKSTINKIRKLNGAIIVSNSGILQNEVLSLPKTIFLNIHASKLPSYRGMNNVEWALYENKPVYVTIHKLSRGIDEGDILYQEEIDLKNKNLVQIKDFRKYCFYKSNEVIGKALRKLFNKEISFIEQENKHEPLLQYYVMHPILKRRLQAKLDLSFNRQAPLD